MKNIIITIGREFGSGGKYIGESVAKKLGIPFYDKEIIEKAYEENNCNYSKLNDYDEKSQNSFLKTLNLMNTNNQEDAYEFDTYQAIITKTVQSLADKGPCVILGRNSNNILKDKDNVINIFIYSKNLDFKIKRKMELENKSYDEISKELKQIDKQRKKYYERINENLVWGAKENYDYLIDSSILGVDATAKLIVEIYQLATHQD